MLTHALPWLALGDLWAGHWPAAAALLSEGLELAQATGRHKITAHLLAVRAMLAALRGENAPCRELAGRSLELAAARRLVHCHVLRHVGARRSRARARAAGGGAGARASASSHRRHREWDALDRIEAAFRAGDPRTARAWLEAFEPWANSNSALWGRTVTLHCRAILGEDRDAAERLFRSALALHEDAARPFEGARTELAFGESLRRARRRTEARSYLRAALDRFETLGAALWAARARVELRASGERSRKRDPSTPDELTAQELQIAQLGGQGGTNRDVAAQLFLSPRTIDFHLRNVFRKLGTGSRVVLARLDLGEAATGASGR